MIARKERPRPGAQLRLTDIDGLWVTAFATNTARGQLPDLELRHRRRARAEARIRNAEDTGLTSLPLHNFTQTQIWCAIIMLGAELAFLFVRSSGWSMCRLGWSSDCLRRGLRLAEPEQCLHAASPLHNHSERAAAVTYMNLKNASWGGPPTKSKTRRRHVPAQDFIVFQLTWYRSVMGS